ncbi:MAG: ABC transporter substrate-binding protein [Mariniblastus sp.]
MLQSHLFDSFSRFRFASLGLLCAIVALGLSSNANAQWLEKESELVGPFVDGEPFDVIFLNDDGDKAIMKVKRLKDFPDEIPTQGQLVFEYFSDDEDKLEVPYSSIAKVKTFEDYLIEESDAWLEEGEYAKSFRNLLWIYDNGGKQDPKLVAALKKCMFQDAKENFEEGDFELALSIFEDIYQRDPSFKVTGINQKLSEIVMACYNGMIRKQFDREDYRGVRVALASVIDQYKDKANTLETTWSRAFKKRSDDLIAQSRQYAKEGKGRLAHLAAKQADQMMPDRPEVLQLQSDLLAQFPLVVVGVSQAASDADPNRFEHWGARRVGRLTQRTIMENTGLTDEGGKYEFPNGLLYRADEIGLKYTFEIKNDVTGFAVPETTAYEVSSLLLDLADPESPSYNVAWAKIVGRISIEDESHVSFTLRTPFVRPEALLKIPYTPADETGQPDQNGSYVMTSLDDDFVTFELNPRYEPKPDRQHPQVVEQVFRSSSEAVDQLIAGNIDVVDRIPLSDIARLKSAKGVNVRPYILPTVHMLVPKIRGEMENDPNFRSGLSHAIDRDLLIKDVICGGKSVEGCEVVSGPFPIGTEDNDQIAYGYDLRVRPLPFNSQLGMVLIRLALRANPPVRPEPIPTPKLVIAHPKSSSAANAAGAIARMWTEVGIPTTTVQLKTGESIPSDDEWDFLYVEVVVEEPLADVTKMIGPYGFAKDVSAPIEQTLRIVSYAQSWQKACSALRRLHRQIAVDLSVIPLWQVKEHYAYRSTVRGVGRDLIHLYQNVDRWNIDLTEQEEQQGK